MIIIGLSGRKGCGKTELAKTCINKGFKILSFADALKDLVCELISVTREELQNSKEKDISYICDNKTIDIIFNHTNIDKEKLIPILLDKKFAKPREILQFIGTDIIRQFSPNWHIEQLSKKIDSNNNYCIDDLRFPNEKNFLDKLGAYLFYIIRPCNFEFSNHESEVSLKWNDFQNTIINNYKLTTLIGKWSNFIDILINPFFKINSLLEYQFDDPLKFRIWLQNQLLSKSSIEIAEELKCSRDKIVWWANKLMLRVPRENYCYDEKAFLITTPLFAYACGLLTSDGCIKTSPTKRNICISFTSCDKELADIMRKAFGTDRPFTSKIHPLSKKIIYDIDCQNYYIGENLKHWNIKPRKSMYEQVPDIIKNDEIAIKHWIVGMIDGDGSVCIAKKNCVLIIFVLGSKEVVEFISEKCPYYGAISPHKKTKLFQIVWNNYCAIDVYNWLKPAADDFGLKRKWKNIDVFLGYPGRQGRRKFCKKPNFSLTSL